MADKKTDETKPVKKKGKPRGGNSPMIGNNGLDLEPGDNSKYLAVGLQLFNLPDIDLHDSKQVEDRLAEYFKIHYEADLKPTVAGMGMALNGMDRRRLWEIRTDVPDRNKDLPTATRDSIKKAYKYMEMLWENYMQNGKINPVSGIFLGKNNFGYTDKQEHVITPNTSSDSEYNAEDIKQRYLTDSPTIEQLPDFCDSEEG